MFTVPRPAICAELSREGVGGDVRDRAAGELAMSALERALDLDAGQRQLIGVRTPASTV